MSEELFEKYCRSALSAEEAEELKRILREDPEGRNAFARYMHERSILVQLTGRNAGEQAVEVVPERASRGAVARPRRRRRVPGGSSWTPFAVAAAVLVAIALGLALLPAENPPIDPPSPTARQHEPAPEAPPAPETPRPELVRVPAPVPTVPRDDRRPQARPPTPEPAPGPVVRKPVPETPPPPKPPDPAPKTIPAVASLGGVKGEVLVAGKPARNRQPVLAGQGVETRGEKSAAVLTFPDGTRVTLSGAVTLLEVDEIRKEDGGKRIFLLKGTLTADVRKQRFVAPMIFTTPHGTARVLGTTLRISVDTVLSPGATRLEVTKGKVRLARAGNSVHVRSGYFAVAAPGVRLAVRRLTAPVAAFDAMPAWKDVYNAAWGGAATWRLGPGVTGRGLRISRASEGSSVRVLVVSVPANSVVDLSAFLRCPRFGGDYWVEVGYRLGGHSAADFDVRPQSWTVLKKFDPQGENGNQDRWVRYVHKVQTGTFRQITLGFKLGSMGGGGPVVGCDEIRITPP